MYFLDGFSTVILVSRLIISWISDASFFLWGLLMGSFSSVGYVPSGGCDPWPSVTAVFFVFVSDIEVLQLSMRPTHPRCRRCGLLLA